jgi:hypothetical protein
MWGHEQLICISQYTLTFWRICFSVMTMVSPRRFLIRFFSSFLQAYILPVERVWQAHTSPNPPLPARDKSIIDSPMFRFKVDKKR